jgi:hypothetical protein
MLAQGSAPNTEGLALSAKDGMTAYGMKTDDR